MEEKVMHLMKRGAITCAADTSIKEVAQIMVLNRIQYCVVVNESLEVEGIISARSILKAFGRDPDKTRAKDILLPYTFTITPDSPLKEAIDLMAEKNIEHLAVVSERAGGKMVLGILHSGDIIHRMANP